MSGPDMQPHHAKQLTTRASSRRALWSVGLALLLALTTGCALIGASRSGSTNAEEAPAPENEPLPGLCQLELSCRQKIPDPEKIVCAFSIVDVDGNTVYDDHVGVEQRGRSTRRAPKKNYSLELRSRYGEDNAANLLGMGSEQDWILDGSWVDRSLVRNQLVGDLYRSLASEDRWAPRGRFCRLTLDDKPRGIYRLVERIKKDKNRLDLAEEESFVLKQGDRGAIDWEVSELQTSYRLVYPKDLTATLREITAVQEWVDGLDAALRDPDGGPVFEFLDLDASVDFVLIQELSKNVDAYQLSIHVFKDAEGTGQLVPWDFDLSMGVPAMIPEEGRRNLDLEIPQAWINKRTPLIDGMARVPKFRERMVERWRAHREGPLSREAIFAKIDEYVAVLEPGLAENNELWPIARINVAKIYSKFSSYRVTTHQEEIDRLKDWLKIRLAWIDENIESYPGGDAG